MNWIIARAWPNSPGVRRLAHRFQKAIFPTGTAIHLLRDRAVDELERLGQLQRDPLSRRVAVFLQVWYCEQGTAIAVADALGLSRSFVAHRIHPVALDLVARRFPKPAWQAEAS